MIIVGAGVVGLAVAGELAQAGLTTVVLERHAGPGRETSSRNSEVIHAGIYYPPGSLRARLCVRGNRLLYRFCEQNGVATRALGKLIVASTDEEIPLLEDLLRRGQANGALDLRLVDGPGVARLEPAVAAVAGLLSPSTGIVDTHGLTKALEGKARALGAELLYRCEVIDVEPGERSYSVTVRNPSGSEQLVSRSLVNAAGLDSDRVSAMAGVPYRLHWCKGDYFSVSSRRASSVSRLVYPVPNPHLVGLGVHITLDLGGRMRLGPDATYVEREAGGMLDVDPLKSASFWTAARRYLPSLALGDLQPDMAGIRPKLQGPADGWRDFVVQEDRPGLVNLVGIDSPGLTACLAIGELVGGVIRKYL